jgi:hypothetical protein
MSLAITVDDIFVLKGAMLQLDRGCAINHPSYIEEHAGQQGNIVVLTEFSSTKQELFGSATWGLTGFTFRIVINSSNQIAVRLDKHSGNILSQPKMEEILQKALSWTKRKLHERLHEIDSDIRSSYKGMMIQTKKDSAANQKSYSNLDEFKASNVIDAQFYSFIKSHLNRFQIKNYK